MRKLALSVVLLLLAGTAFATTSTTTTVTTTSTTTSTLVQLLTPSGTFTTAQTTTGNSPDYVCPTIARSLVVTAVNSSGTATFDVEIGCGAVNWGAAAGTSTVLSGTTPGVVVIPIPTCCYRTNVTACGGCSVTTTYQEGADCQ